MDREAIDDRIDAWLHQLTLDEKLSLLAGKSFWKTRGIPRLGICSLHLTDGTRGVAFHSSFKRCTAFPSSIGVAATWNTELTYRLGEALGQETADVGAQVILGPGINICRTPLNGRTFEYFTEDPKLNSAMAVAMIRGIQSVGVAACVKHFAANNQETWRMQSSSEVSERALQEIYLPAFKAAVEEAGVLSVMAAYNAVNGVAACENKALLTDKLRNAFGFDGLVVSDWFATRRTTSGGACLDAGLNLEMPGKGYRYKPKNLRNELEAGLFTEDTVDRALRGLLKLVLATENSRELAQSGARGSGFSRQTAYQVAVEGITLLKNDDAMLPLGDNIRRLAVVGPFARKKNCYPLISGSAAVWPTYEVTPYQGIKRQMGDKVKFVTRPEDADAVVLVLGQGHRLGGDSEARDRASLALQEKQQRLLEKTLEKNPNTVVVLISGSPLEMPWLDKVPAVLYCWYPGSEGGNAIADILCGRACPSGKLPVTFPRKLEDSPAHRSEETFPGNESRVCYDEDVFVGYRHFDSHDVEPLFPFGHGLSYTTFDYQSLSVAPDTWNGATTSTIRVGIQNTGATAGDEVVQLYIAPRKPSLPRPSRELKGFTKVQLQPGECAEVSFELSPSDLAYFCPVENRWKIDAGDYQIQVGSSSRSIHLSHDIRYGEENGMRQTGVTESYSVRELE